MDFIHTSYSSRMWHKPEFNAEVSKGKNYASPLDTSLLGMKESFKIFNPQSDDKN